MLESIFACQHLSHSTLEQFHFSIVIFKAASQSTLQLSLDVTSAYVTDLSYQEKDTIGILVCIPSHSHHLSIKKQHQIQKS